MKIGKHTARLAEKFRVNHGRSFRLKDFDPADTAGVQGKEKCEELLQHNTAVLNELQEKLYAQDQWAILLIFQAMDAAGKDGVIKHVMSGVNPQGCQVTSFKQPSTEELDHDYMWRAARALPQRGHIGIFNRSYYEEVLVVRVHPELLVKQHLPEELVSKRIWKERFEDIQNFEQYLSHNGVIVRKFFLHVSKETQKERFLKRLEEPEKNWKFSDADVLERKHWDDYMNAYNDMICHTATPDAPWYIVPADHKYVTHLVVSSAIIETLRELKLEFPQVDSKRRKELETAEAALKGKAEKQKQNQKS